MGEVIVGHLTGAEMEAEGDIVTNRSIVSVVQSPTQQNITISVGVRSFASPLTLFFDWAGSFQQRESSRASPQCSPLPETCATGTKMKQAPKEAPPPPAK